MAKFKFLLLPAVPTDDPTVFISPSVEKEADIPHEAYLAAEKELKDGQRIFTWYEIVEQILVE